MVEPANPIQILILTNEIILISEIDEVVADIGQPDCKLINPCTLLGGKVERWMSVVTTDNVMFISSDKIVTLVDPSKHILEEYKKFIQ